MGAERVIKQTPKGLSVTFFKNGKKIKRKLIRLMEPEEAKKKGYVVHGPASGQDLFHCIWMARHGDNVIERSCAYSVNNSPKDKSFAMEVTFYEKKP